MSEVSNFHKALVTGGAGFIGSHLVEFLLQKKIKVRILDNFSSGKKENISHISGPLEVIQGDICKTDEIQRAMQGVDIVFHVAALPSVPRSVIEPIPTMDANIGGSINVLETARICGIKRIVLSSSSSVYGNSDVLPKTESLTCQPASPYAASKYTMEILAHTFGHCYPMEIFCLRYFNVYGPRQDPEGDYAAVIPRFIAALLQGKPPLIFGTGQQTRDFTYIDDVVQANWLAAQSPKGMGENYNIAGGTPVTILELAQTISKILKKDIPPEFKDPRPGDIQFSYASYDSAQTHLGWTPQIPLKEGLEKTVRWFMDH